MGLVTHNSFMYQRITKSVIYATGTAQHSSKHTEVDTTKDAILLMKTILREKMSTFILRRWNVGIAHNICKIKDTLDLFGISQRKIVHGGSFKVAIRQRGMSGKGGSHGDESRFEGSKVDDWESEESNDSDLERLNHGFNDNNEGDLNSDWE